MLVVEEAALTLLPAIFLEPEEPEAAQMVQIPPQFTQELQT